MIVDAIAIYAGAALLGYYFGGLIGAGAVLLGLGLVGVVLGTVLEPRDRPPR